MRRAFRPQSPIESEPEALADSTPGWTKQQLLEAIPDEHGGAISPKTFDTIRKAARVSGPSHGGRNHVFSVQDLITLIEKAESGRFTERGGAPAAAWRGLLKQVGITLPAATRRRTR